MEPWKMLGWWQTYRLWQPFILPAVPSTFFPRCLSMSSCSSNSSEMVFQQYRMEKAKAAPVSSRNLGKGLKMWLVFCTMYPTGFLKKRSAFLIPLFLLPLSMPFLPSRNFSSSQSYCLPIDRQTISRRSELLGSRSYMKQYPWFLTLRPSSTGAFRTHRQSLCIFSWTDIYCIQQQQKVQIISKVHQQLFKKFLLLIYHFVFFSLILTIINSEKKNFKFNIIFTLSVDHRLMSDVQQNKNVQKKQQESAEVVPQASQEEQAKKVDDDLKKQEAKVQIMVEKMKISDQEKTVIPAELDNTSQSVEKTKSSQISGQTPQTTELTDTKYFVEINRTNIMFGKSTLFPGSIQEVDVSIGLKDEIIEDNGSNPYMLRVIARCNNAEFNDLDEYVFSVRSNQRFQYFEEVRFKIRKKERAQVKVAVKIPPVKDNYVIEGFLEIQLESLQPVCLPIYAKCEVPQILCIKDLYKPDEDTQVIKIPAKKNQIRMPPIPFKNLSNFNFTLEVQAIANQSFTNRPYDIITQNFVNCQANTQFFVNLQLKENMSYKGPMPTKDFIRKILVLKIKGSSLYYNYPIEVFVFESSNAGGMS